MNLQELNGKRVVLWGLGREGWSFLNAVHRRGVRPQLNILSDSEISAAERERIVSFSNTSGIPIPIFSGADSAAAFESAEILVKSPGVSLYRPEVVHAKARGVLVTSTTSLWAAERQGGRVIAVSGTKGKSTTSLLIAKLLEAAGKTVCLGGNIGTPLLDLLDRPGGVDSVPEFWVVELSSYQIADAELSPDIGVLLNLYPEHVDWHGTVERYYEDKLRLISLLGENSVLVRNGGNPRLEAAPRFAGEEVRFNTENGFRVQEGFFWEGSTRLFSIANVKLYGAHNLLNICAAMAVYRLCGLDPRTAQSTVENFSGLPHRLTFVAEKNSVLYIDDSISTVPQSAIAAFRAFPERWITAILGGFERAQDWDELADGICDNGVRFVITLPDCGPNIANALRRRLSSGDVSIPIIEAENLRDAVRFAAKETPGGGVVLLSPAAPSYGHFLNFEERGDRFQAFVNQLID